MPFLRYLVHDAASVGDLLHDGCRYVSEILLVASLVVTRVNLVCVAATTHLKYESQLSSLHHNFISMKTMKQLLMNVIQISSALSQSKMIMTELRPINYALTNFLFIF